MSIFSEKLKSIIQEKHIVINDMAKKCQIDHSTFYKILNGKRLPVSKALIVRMAEYLNLSPDESEPLFELYDVMKLGEETFYQRKYVKEFIEKLNVEKELNILSGAGTLEFQEGTFAIEGADSVNKIVEHIVKGEYEKAGRVRMICQSDYDFLYTILCMNKENPKFMLEHILCLENDSSCSGSVNMKSIGRIAPLLKESFDYHLMYFYDRIQARTGRMSLFPHMILGENQAILLSFDYTRGLYYTDKPSVEMLGNIFRECREYVKPFVLYDAELSDLKAVMEDEALNEPNQCYILCPAPYFGHLCEPELWVSLLKQDLPNREEMEQFLKADNQPFMVKKVRESVIYSYFTREGCEDFYFRGHVVDRLSDFCNIMPKEERKKLIQKVLNEIRDGRMKTRLLKREQLKMNRDFYLVLFNDTLTSCTVKRRNQSYAMMTFKENMICRAIYDFMTSLDDSGMVESEEETVQYLEELLMQ